MHSLLVSICVGNSIISHFPIIYPNYIFFFQQEVRRISSCAFMSASTLPRSGGENLSLSGRREKSFWAQIAGGPAAAICLHYSQVLNLSKGIWWNVRLIFRRVKAPQSARIKTNKDQAEDTTLLLEKQLTKKSNTTAAIFQISLIKSEVEFMKMLRWQTRWVQNDQLMIMQDLQVQLWRSRCVL